MVYEQVPCTAGSMPDLRRRRICNAEEHCKRRRRLCMRAVFLRPPYLLWLALHTSFTTGNLFANLAQLTCPQNACGRSSLAPAKYQLTFVHFDEFIPARQLACLALPQLSTRFELVSAPPRADLGPELLQTSRLPISRSPFPLLQLARLLS